MKVETCPKKDYKKQYYLDNRERILKRMKQYRKDNVKILQERVLIYKRDNPEKLKKTRHESYKKRYRKRKQFIDEYKLSGGCFICGYKKCPEALEFHHNGDKNFNIAKGLGQNMSLEKIKREMAKCNVLCNNCHAELHTKERQVQEWWDELDYNDKIELMETICPDEANLIEGEEMWSMMDWEERYEIYEAQKEVEGEIE